MAELLLLSPLKVEQIPHDPRPSTINHIVRLPGMAKGPQIKKDILIRQDRDYLPGGKSKDHTSLWVRLNSLPDILA